MVVKIESKAKSAEGVVVAHGYKYVLISPQRRKKRGELFIGKAMRG
jgi:hypothetical protein